MEFAVEKHGVDGEKPEDAMEEGRKVIQRFLKSHTCYDPNLEKWQGYCLRC